MKENIIQEKTFAFAVRIVNLYKYLKENKKEYVLSKQILKSGTSIGANIEEAIGGESKKDFISKISIAYKKSRETNYWLRLMKETELLNEAQFAAIEKDLIEIIKIITSIKNSSKIIN